LEATAVQRRTEYIVSKTVMRIILPSSRPRIFPDGTWACMTWAPTCIATQY
jgi:hypothetical protein